ncbi:MAG: uroporphyrinogen-III synthase, partial [Candidatus Nitrosotenuis sp.]|nr:uroporphyrinogen-III synthase [Candidatus Nitrosotenuis sp.]
MISGKTIAITRSEQDSEEFSELAVREHAIPISLPTIELVSKGDEIVNQF